MARSEEVLHAELQLARRHTLRADRVERRRAQCGIGRAPARMVVRVKKLESELQRVSLPQRHSLQNAAVQRVKSGSGDIHDTGISHSQGRWSSERGSVEETPHAALVARQRGGLPGHYVGAG